MYRYIIRYGIFYSIFMISIVSCISNEKRSYRNRRSIQKSNLRIINGIEDTTNRYPFVVALGEPVELILSDEDEKRNLYPEFLPSCSGSLVNEEWVLTASHCIWEFEGRTLPTRIRYGHMTVAPNDTRATFSDVRKAILHPSYRNYKSALRNDIGLLLVNKVYLNLYGRISAVDYRTLVGLPVIYTGYGGINGSKSEETLLSRQHKSRQYGEAVVVPCSKRILWKPMICLARKCANKGQMAYYGDSGGPLLHAGRIVGVCSGVDPTDVYTVGMGKTTVMYTAASPYLDWLLTTMSKT